MCEDFEDGAWYYFPGSHDYQTDNKGWKGEFGPQPDPEGENYGRCLPSYVGGVAGTDCSGVSINDADGQGNQGRHKFNAGAVNEIYIRFYIRMASGYLTGLNHHKLLSIGWADALQGEQHIIIDLRRFTGTPDGVGCVMVGEFEGGAIEPTNTCWLFQNQGNDIGFAEDHWYYLEYQIKLNTVGQSNGIYRMWADDCGTDGLDCTGSGTLRTQYTDGAGFREEGQLEVILFEAWQNNNFSGERYWDQIVVATERVGPMALGGGGGGGVIALYEAGWYPTQPVGGGPLKISKW
jgi:hypothetical protein